MVMKTGEFWHCTNTNCRCEVFVKTTGEVQGENPRCTCGGTMKKNYVPPFVSYLQFLREEEPLPVPARSRED